MVFFVGGFCGVVKPVGDLIQDIFPDSCLDPLSQDLYPGGVVVGEAAGTHDAFHFVESEEPWSVGGFHEGTGVDFVVGFGDGGDFGMVSCDG